MNIPEIVTGLEVRAKAAGLSIDDACKRARFHPSTFYRWKNGDSLPTLRLLARLEDAIVAAENPTITAEA